MKLFNTDLELLAIRAFTRLSEQDATKFAAKLDSSHFHFGPASECWKRAMFILKDRNYKATWSDLKVDPGLSLETKKVLKVFKQKPKRDPKYIEQLADSLNQYRQARILFQGCQHVMDSLAKGEKIEEVKPLLQDISEQITIARQVKGSEDQFLHIGRNVKEMLKVVDRVLSSESQRFIPTGLRDFDRQNTGLGRGTVTLMGATTGGGKSLVSRQIMGNMADWGARCCMVTLEMDRDEMMARSLSLYAGVDVSVFQNPTEKLTPKERKRLRKKIFSRAKALNKKGAVETFYAPEGDITSDEMFMLLKPMGYDVIVVDYVGLLKDAAGDNQWQKLGEIVRTAKRFATNTNAAVIVNVQVSDEGMVKYSRTMLEHVDLALIWVMDEEARETKTIEINIAKARKQKQFKFKLKTVYEKMRVENCSEKERYDEREEKPEKPNKDKKFSNTKKSPFEDEGEML